MRLTTKNIRVSRKKGQPENPNDISFFSTISLSHSVLLPLLGNLTESERLTQTFTITKSLCNEVTVCKRFIGKVELRTNGFNCSMPWGPNVELHGNRELRGNSKQIQVQDCKDGIGESPIIEMKALPS